MGMMVNSSYVPNACAVNPQNFCIDVATGSSSWASFAPGVVGYEVFDANGNSDFTLLKHTWHLELLEQLVTVRSLKLQLVITTVTDGPANSESTTRLLELTLHILAR